MGGLPASAKRRTKRRPKNSQSSGTAMHGLHIPWTTHHHLYLTSPGMRHAQPPLGAGWWETALVRKPAGACSLQVTGCSCRLPVARRGRGGGRGVFVLFLEPLSATAPQPQPLPLLVVGRISWLRRVRLENPLGHGNCLSGLKLSGERDGGLGLARSSVVCPLGGHMYANGL
jgi:hypothetical protein